ncbi:MAG: hypothetical protein VX112_03310 [Pseudomonadota bacterium]|nr:hypothetical protein [Pseudomonadota bacterium]
MFSKKRSLRGHLTNSFRVSEWMGISLMVKSGRSIYSMYENLVTPPKATRRESFHDAVSRLHISEKDIKSQMYYYKMTSSIYGLFCIFGIIYAMILFVYGTRGAFIMSCSYCCLIGSFFFRESFWYMQIKNRRLGMSPYDWLRFMVGLS